MENESKLLREPSSGSISLIMRNRLCQKASRRNDLLVDESFDNHNSTGGQTIPKALIDGIDLELGKSVFPLLTRSRLTARKAVGNADRGNLKKQMPSCNGKDRGKVEIVVTADKANALTRKGADFRMVCKRNAIKQLTQGSR